MLCFSANIEILHDQQPFLQRIKRAKDSGFDAIEFWSWENKDLQLIKGQCEESSLFVSSLSGDGNEYSLCDDAHLKGYVDYLRASFEAAKKVGSKMVVIHSNALDNGKVVNAYADIPSHRLYMNMIKTLLCVAPYAEKEGICCVLEPLNTTVDHQGNLLSTIKDASLVVEAVDSPYIKVLYDFYHMQIMSGDLCNTYDRFASQIAHIHIADHPGRHEPGTGEIHYKKVIDHLEDRGYRGVVAFELSPLVCYDVSVEAIMALRK